MNLERLRDILAAEVHRLSQTYGHKDLEGVAARLGIGAPGEGSKAERMRAAFELVTNEDLPRVARRFLVECPLVPDVRNQLEEILWAEDRGVVIPKRYRRELAKELGLDDLWLDGRRFLDLLERVWVLGQLAPFCGHHGFSLRDEIDQHVFRNHDLTPEDLFDYLGAYDCSDRRFAKFIEGLSASDVRPDVQDQRRFAAVVNKVLAGCGVELVATAEDGGYPVFAMVSKGRGTPGRPKNLIFASSVKPDLRFRDAVNNDIEIVTNADKVLVYDRAIGAEGLRWRELQDWWSETTGAEDPEEAKSSLYRRLEKSLPVSSPPQRLLFDAFYRGFGPRVPDLPALLPEVWLHWDPRTVEARGRDALLRFRMDFLLLLPAGARVVVEVDGRQHYSDDSGRALPEKYAEMVAADRDLRLAGYEVYRFGAAELDSDSGRRSVEAFFRALFGRHGVA